MKIPAEIAFEHVDHSDAIETRLRDELDKLEQFHDRITSARVVVSRPQHRHRKGDTYDVRIQLSLPGTKDVVVSRKPGDIHAHTDVYIAIRDAFAAARRQLQDHAAKRNADVKTHQPTPRGIIASLVPDADHGFIAADDGRHIYFHRNSVAGNGFDKLQTGVHVEFSEARGDKGPQATFVQPTGRTQKAG